jgi:cystathionine gamma-synthase
MNDSFALATRAARASVGTDPAHGSLMPPVYLSSTFAFAGFDKKRDYDYTRSGNPTRDALGAALAELEGGAGTVVTSSGMAAITLVCHLLEKDDLLLAPHDCYGGTHRLLTALDRKGHFRVQFADLTDSASLRASFAARHAMVLVETPSNPLLRITDFAAVSDLAGACGARIVADNTFLSPVLQRPLELGAHLVVYSTTKYLNGHSDVVGGAVIARERALAEELAWWANCLGLTGAPFDSYLTLRGLRTLELRLAQQERNASAIVELLEPHPAVRKVHYPGLATHPGHALAARQQRGFGAMLSFELEGGTPGVEAFLADLQCISLAESLGGVESLISHPATMTHAGMDPGARREAGIGDGLLRLSAGIEDAGDLIRDVGRGLERVLAGS